MQDSVTKNSPQCWNGRWNWQKFSKPTRSAFSASGVSKNPNRYSISSFRICAQRSKKQKIKLDLENEHACNIATAAESVKLLAAIQDPYLGLNWDPGNAYAAGEKPYPNGYQLL